MTVASGRNAHEYSSHRPESDEVVELAVLMCGEQFRALERIAEAQGLTIAGVIRRSISARLAAERGEPRPPVFGTECV